MLEAAHRHGVQVIWDLCHYGLLHDIDIWPPAFPERFGAFAGAAAPAPVVPVKLVESAVWSESATAQAALDGMSTCPGDAASPSTVDANSATGSSCM